MNKSHSNCTQQYECIEQDNIKWWFIWSHLSGELRIWDDKLGFVCILRSKQQFLEAEIYATKTCDEKNLVRRFSFSRTASEKNQLTSWWDCRKLLRRVFLNGCISSDQEWDRNGASATFLVGPELSLVSTKIMCERLISKGFGENEKSCPKGCSRNAVKTLCPIELKS